MPSADEELKEVRAQRHDFIIEYYKMATADLDRHLKGGWQTIAFLAGGVAVLAAGHDQKIGMPIAVTIAVAASIWGMVTVIDASYWSNRAIAFLSNVEAIYFSKEDRRIFNPYIGYHPPYKLLNSLYYLFLLSLAFGALALLSLLWEIINRYPTWKAIVERLNTIDACRLLMWELPLVSASWGLVWVAVVWANRLKSYMAFVRGSPGPGVRTNSSELRHVTLEALAGHHAPSLEADTHEEGLNELNQVQVSCDARLNWTIAIAVVVTLISLTSTIVKLVVA